MDIHEYINTGILELYALDQLDQAEKAEVERLASLFPEIKAEVDQIQDALEQYAFSNAITPPAQVKRNLTESISNLEKEEKMDLQDLPVINAFSDSTKWLELIQDLIPDEVAKGETWISPLQESDKIVQVLVVATADIPDEVHEESYESFLILKGRCKCTVANEVRIMEEGDFMTIPLNEHHDVEILSENVVAILQHVMV